MSSPIIPIEGPLGLPTVAPPAGGNAERIGMFASELEGESTFALLASRGGPPPEVLEQITAAGTIEAQLRESGRQLRFTRAEDGRTRIEIHDHKGNSLRTLPTAEAFEVAVGKPLE